MVREVKWRRGIVALDHGEKPRGVQIDLWPQCKRQQPALYFPIPENRKPFLSGTPSFRSCLIFLHSSCFFQQSAYCTAQGRSAVHVGVQKPVVLRDVCQGETLLRDMTMVVML